MNNELKTLGFKAGTGFFYDLNATSKLLFFLIVSVSCMMTYDTRFLAFVAIFSIICFNRSKISFATVKTAVTFMVIFALLNLVFVFLFDMHYGNRLYGASTPLFGWLTQQEAFYLFNLLLKYFCTIPLALLFILTTNPSQFASSLNQIFVPYKPAYAVSLALRYIPDIQEKFLAIRNAQMARGVDLSKKASLLKRIRINIFLLLPLVFSSLNQIDTVSTAMELRRFGRGKKRTWYNAQAYVVKDLLTIAFAVILLLIVIALFWVNQGRFFNPWR